MGLTIYELYMNIATACQLHFPKSFQCRLNSLTDIIYWSAKEAEIETLNSALKDKWMNLKPFLSEIVNFILIAIILNKIDNFLFFGVHKGSLKC